MAVLGNKWRKSAGSAKVLPQIYHQLCFHNATNYVMCYFGYREIL